MLMAERGDGGLGSREDEWGGTQEGSEVVISSLESRYLTALGLLLYVRCRLDFVWLHGFGTKFLSFVSHYG